MGKELFYVQIVYPRPGTWYDEAEGCQFWAYFRRSIPNVLMVLPALEYTFPILAVNPEDVVVLFK